MTGGLKYDQLFSMTLNEAKILALELMNEHNVLGRFSFKFENCKSSLGRCHYGKKKYIALSRWYVLHNPIHFIRDTILHEIAHALDFMERGTSDHGKNWKRIARRIGCNPRRCNKQASKPNNHYKYVDTCSCGKTFRKHRIRRGITYFCKKCGDHLYRKRPCKTPEQYQIEKDLLNEIFG